MTNDWRIILELCREFIWWTVVNLWCLIWTMTMIWYERLLCFLQPSRRSCLSVCSLNSQTNTAIVVMPIHLQRGNLMNCCPGVAWWNYVVSDCFLCWLLASCWLRVSAGSVVGSLSRVLPSPVLAWTLSMNVVLSRAGCWFLVCAVV